MADLHNKTTRSYNMSRIKAKTTKPDMKISGAKCLRKLRLLKEAWSLSHRLTSYPENFLATRW